MAAFPQLGYGYKSNTSHIAVEIEASPMARAWWSCLTVDQKVELIIKRYPDCMKQSPLMRMSLWTIHNKNPQKLYDFWVQENEKENKE